MGGVGFIGLYICECLFEVGVEVVFVDNYFIGSWCNIVYFIVNLLFEVVRYDVIFLFYIEVDVIFNLVCLVLFIYYQCDFVQIIKMLVYGVINMFGFVKWFKVWIFQVLISEVYGDLLIYLQMEDYWGNVNLIGICFCYDEGKCCVEILFFDYWCQYGLLIKVVWIFNIYGLRMQLNDGCVVLFFIVQVFKGELIMVFGDGGQICLFCYVDDFVEVIMCLMVMVEDVIGLINFGNNFEFMIWEFVERVIKFMGLWF